MEDRELAKRALAARDGSHSPYSCFRVGAAILCDDGDVIEAANLENASLGLSVCAERNAVARAVFLGKRKWTRIAVATDAEDFIPPCGACLQVLREFAAQLDVLLVNDAGEFRRHALVELSPLPFTEYPGASRGGRGA